MRRFLVAALLVLAASPLTAPFSIGSPLDLFGGEAAQVQAKKPPDDPTVLVMAPLRLVIVTGIRGAVPGDNSSAPPMLRRPHHLPLRV